MGVAPIRIDVISVIDGVEFNECYPMRTEDILEDIPVHLINLEHLKKINARVEDQKTWQI